jgi:hypothetical protein
MLGLLSTLARRERMQAAQMLDERIATTLRTHSRHHQHDTVFALLQRQAELMPTLVDRLESMATTMARQNEALGERLSASQDAFHTRTEAAYARLADTVGQSLKEGIADSARRQHGNPASRGHHHDRPRPRSRHHARHRHADRATASGRPLHPLRRTTTAVADTWRQALAEHQQVNTSLTSDLRASLDGFGETFAQRSQHWSTASARASTQPPPTPPEHGIPRCRASNIRANRSPAPTTRRWPTLGRLRATSRRHRRDGQPARQLAIAIGGTGNGRQTALAERDETRLSAWRDTLASMATTMRDEWQRASTQSAADQQDVRDALAQSARDIATRGSRDRHACRDRPPATDHDHAAIGTGRT